MITVRCSLFAVLDAIKITIQAQVAACFLCFVVVATEREGLHLPFLFLWCSKQTTTDTLATTTTTTDALATISHLAGPTQSSTSQGLPVASTPRRHPPPPPPAPHAKVSFGTLHNIGKIYSRGESKTCSMPYCCDRH